MAVGGMDNGDVTLVTGMIWGVCSVVGAGVFGYFGGLYNKEWKNEYRIQKQSLYRQTGIRGF